MTDDSETSKPAEPSGAFTPPAIPYGSSAVPPIEPLHTQDTGFGGRPHGSSAYGGQAGPSVHSESGHQQAWTPPPKPGLIPLRPLDFGILLGAPFTVLRRNPKASFGSALLIQLGVMVVSLGLVGLVSAFAIGRIASSNVDDRGTVAAGSIALVAVSGLIAIAVGVLGSALLQALLVIEVSREILGERRTFGFLWRTAWKRFAPLLGFFLLVVLAFLLVTGVFVGIIAVAAAAGGTGGVVIAISVSLLLGLGVAVLGAWLGVKLALVPCAIVLERASLKASIARSWQLTNGAFWKTFGVLVLVNLIVWVASQVVTTPISLLFGVSTTFLDPNDSSSTTPTGLVITLVVLYVVTAIVSLIFGAITSVVQAGATVLIYVDLRMRREGLDLELTRYVEAGGTTSSLPDPFDPVPG